VIALLLKEWRQLLSIAWLWLGLFALSIGPKLFTARLDEESYANWCSDYCSRGADLGVVVMLIVLLLVVAYSLYPREFDDSTIDFLHSLPVSKLSLFVAKFFAAWTLVCLLALFMYALEALLLSVNSQSIDGIFYPQIHLALLYREFIFFFIILSHGVFLSCFRLPGLLLYATYLIGISYLESRFGELRPFNVTNTLFNQFEGQELVHDWKTIMVQMLGALIFLVAGFFIWSRKENTGSSEKHRSIWTRLLMWLLGGLVFLLLALTMIQRVMVSTGQNDDIGTFSLENAYYRFVFPDRVEGRAYRMEKTSEPDYERLAQLLNSTQRPFIHADMTADNPHVPGIAKWKKIKMDVSGTLSDTDYRRILSHETAHVFQGVEARGALSRNFSTTRFFIEGMAQFTSFRIVPDEANWRLASQAWRRQNILFDDMLDNRTFVSRYDAELYYSLGDIWTEALVVTCGEAVLGNILRTAGRENAPVDLPGGLYWRDLLQRVDCELESVNSTWRELMEAQLRQSATGSFPEFSTATFSRNEKTGRIQARVEVTGDDEWPERFSIRIRNEKTLKQTVDAQYPGTLKESENGFYVEFSIPSEVIALDRFWYQLGFEPEAGSRSYFERWQTGAL